MQKIILPILFSAAALSLSACQSLKKDEPPVGSLTRTLLLTDPSGTRYGTIEMDPITGGRMFDAQGRLIGAVVTPATTSTVTTVTPVTPIYPATTTVTPQY